MNMNKITKSILKKLILNYEDVKNPEIRLKYGILEARISIIGNIILFVFKLFFGILVNSISLIADSFHTLSDIVTSIVVLIGFKTSQLPADEKHPYGHGRGESIATLIIGVLLIVVGIEFLKISFGRLIHPETVRGSLLVAILLVLSAFIKEWMAIFSIDLGKSINSSTLIADAWHHRSDAIASLLVAIALVSSIFGYFAVDSILGIVVSLLIIYVGFVFSKSSVSFLIGEAPDEELINKIKKYAGTVQGVKGVHDIQVHNYGHRLEVSLHIEIDNDYAFLTSHKIADTVEKKLFNELNLSSVVHVDPLK